MEQLKFKTNIKCSGCVASVTPFLNETAGDGNWSVNLSDVNRILTVEGKPEKQRAIIEAVEKAGYKAEVVK